MVQTIVRWLLVFVIIVSGAGAAWWLISSRKAPPQVERKVQAPLVKVQDIRRQDVTMLVKGYGTVQAKNMVKLVPQVSGKVIGVAEHLVSGDFVQANEILLTIDPRDYELAVRRHEASVARARTALDRELAEAEVAQAEWREISPDKLPPSGLVFRQPQIRQAEAELAATEAELATAQLYLERTKVSLPFNGRVVSEEVAVGQYVVAGQPVAMVYGTEVMEVPVPLEDSELQWFSAPLKAANPGSDGADELASAEVVAEFGGQERRWQGKVVRTEGQVDPGSRMVSVIVEVERPFEGADGECPLVPGMFVETTIQGRTLEKAMQIPRYAIHNMNEVWAVEEGRLRIRPVQIARADEQWVYVVGGLGDQVTIVMSPMDAVTDGMEVRTREESKVEPDELGRI